MGKMTLSESVRYAESGESLGDGYWLKDGDVWEIGQVGDTEGATSLGVIKPQKCYRCGAFRSRLDVVKFGADAECSKCRRTS